MYMLQFQLTVGTSTVTAVAATVEPPPDKFVDEENKSLVSSPPQVIIKSVPEASGVRESAGVQDDRERLTFHVALGESGFASLGISVTKVFRNRQDCGIFIKSVRIGGMAAKVCELSTVAVKHFCI